jgi:(1->4)-alpha-D-glucan 1-alpha-D-glucosylmutase
MVDPDNRHPVDFARRTAFLSGLPSHLNSESVGPLLNDWPDGRIKLLILSRLLRLRRRMPDLFLAGGYHPLTIEGPRTDHLCAFARMTQTQALLVVVPRFFVSLTDGRTEMPEANVWSDTFVVTPPELAGRPMTNLFTGESVLSEAHGDGTAWAAGALLRPLPYGIWLSEREAGTAEAAPA